MSASSLPLLRRPGFQIAATLSWGVFAVGLLVGFVLGPLGIELAVARAWWQEHLVYVQPYLEGVVAGLIPVLFVLTGRERLSRFGLRVAGLTRSVALSIAFVALRYCESFLRTGDWIAYQSFATEPGFALALWTGAVGVVANGPLEAFLVIWLIAKTDQLLGGTRRVVSGGLILVSVGFGLVHVLSTQDITNALYVGVIFFSLGWIFRYTGNSIGPMLGWTLINGMSLAYLELVFG